MKQLKEDEIRASLKSMIDQLGAEEIEAFHSLITTFSESTGDQADTREMLQEYLQHQIENGGIVDESNPKKKVVVKTTIPPEQKYVRRTAEEFAAGAKPVKERGSHRLVGTSLSLIPEVIDARKDAAKTSGHSIALWSRAALRKALREGLDVEYELSTPIQSTEPKPPLPEPEQ